MAEHYKNYLAGEWLDASEQIEVFNPATEALVGTIACGGEADIDAAVARARAFVDGGGFNSMPPADRARMLHRIAAEIRVIADDAVPLLVAENGKTHDQAQTEFDNAARYFEYYAGMADKIEGRSIPLGEDYVGFTYYEPLGVSAQIVPWNFPVDLTGRSLAPALAAGNAVIIKSPELTPLAMTSIVTACERAGMPAGALSLICGHGPIAGAHLAQHADIDQIVFTGSVATGRSILRAAAEHATPCVMELGGKSAAVVFADADLDNLIDSVDWGIFFNAGQVCSAMSRLLVHESIQDQVVDRLHALAQSQIIGDGGQPSTTLTPLASAKQRDQVLALCQQGVSDGAQLITGGAAPDRPGYFVQPTLFNQVPPKSALFQQEVFGPVLSITPFSHEDEAWALANGTDYGLVAGIFTEDLNVALRGSKALKAGQVFVNEWFAGGVETPFGGTKLSGYGREKGQEALFNYVQTKNVAIRLC